MVLIERWPTLGGVCLNVGCIPSKALLHAAKVIDETQDMGNHGIRFTDPTIDIDALRGWKDGVVKKLTGGLTGLAKQRKVNVVSGFGRFISLNQVEVEQADGSKKVVTFDQAIIAAAEPVTLPFIPHDPRDRQHRSAGAGRHPEALLVLGGGIIGLEMATVYHALGSKVTIVELMDQIIPGADKDIVTPLMKRIQKKYENIHLKTKVTKVEATGRGWSPTSRAARRPRPTPSTASWWRSGGGRTGAPSGRRTRASRWTSAATSRWTSRCGPTWRTSSRSATWSASRCWRTRRSTRAGWRRRPPRARTASSTPR